MVSLLCRAFFSLLCHPIVCFSSHAFKKLPNGLNIPALDDSTLSTLPGWVIRLRRVCPLFIENVGTDRVKIFLIRFKIYLQTPRVSTSLKTCNKSDRFGLAMKAYGYYLSKLDINSKTLCSRISKVQTSFGGSPFM